MIGFIEVSVRIALIAARFRRSSCFVVHGADIDADIDTDVEAEVDAKGEAGSDVEAKVDVDTVGLDSDGNAIIDVGSYDDINEDANADVDSNSRSVSVCTPISDPDPTPDSDCIDILLADGSSIEVEVADSFDEFSTVFIPVSNLMPRISEVSSSSYRYDDPMTLSYLSLWLLLSLISPVLSL